ncbi:MAG TPA: NADAR family protein [Verrucomicrobiae bacterium]
MSTSIRSIDQLNAELAKGARPKYLYFWGHTPANDGSVTKSCFSQWWVSPFVIDGITYPTAEHYMMASKARLFDDQEACERVLTAKHPKQAKEIGRQVKGFDDAVWKEERFGFVVTGNHAKFSQHADLRYFLLNTGDKVLIEASPYDRIWGIGLSASDERAEKPSQWRGLNLLGFALMEVRERLKV